MKLIAAGAIGVGAYLITRMAFGAMGKEYLPEKPGPEGYLPRTYDQIFIEECGDTVRGREDPYPPMIPVEYLRALAKKESDFDPNRAEPGHAVGLLQVALKDVLYEYNELYGTSYASAARKDPRINARVACELIGRISRFLPSYAPKAFPKGRFDWTSRREVKILTLAWNAGWSSRGVGGMLRNLIREGYSANQITAEAIHQKAKDYPEIDKIFSEQVKTRLGWVNDVANYYFRELRAPIG